MNYSEKFVRQKNIRKTRLSLDLEVPGLFAFFFTFENLLLFLLLYTV